MTTTFLADVRIPATQPMTGCVIEIAQSDVAWLLHAAIFPAVEHGAQPVAVTYRGIPFSWQITIYGIGILHYHGDPRHDAGVLAVITNLHVSLANDLGGYVVQIRFEALEGGDPR